MARLSRGLVGARLICMVRFATPTHAANAQTLAASVASHRQVAT